MKPKITLAQIEAVATKFGIEAKALRCVLQVECKASGFDAQDNPTILFERHVFRQRLIANGLQTIATKAQTERPDLCQPTAGGYGTFSSQHKRLVDACVYDRTSALESASWGLGQVMGYQWRSLGYASMQAFINAIYKDEPSQLEAVCRYIKVNNLVDKLNSHDWAGFARGYNGPNYKINQYDVKLKQAYDALR